MKILVVGGGGREHALAWKIAQSPLVTSLYIAPGNGGTPDLATHVDIGAEDVAGLVNWAKAEKPDLVVVGPEAPLVAGLADQLNELGIAVFGPSAAAAQLEGSKGFVKDLCARHKIPTAAYGRFTDAASAKAYIQEQGAPIVVKADGLAAGKGVTVAETVDQALAAIDDCFDGAFGDAGAEVVVEEFMDGEEASFFVLTDGENALQMATAQDHKRVGDGDTGPNTGGMGAYSPAPVMTDALIQKTMDEIVLPTIKAMKDEGYPYKGVLYAGLMIEDADGPAPRARLVEYNARFGDPECQVLMLRLASDIVPALMAVANGTLGDETLDWHKDPAMTVVMAAKGYPGAYAKGTKIELPADTGDGVVFHAGTKLVDGELQANGGRVLNVTTKGSSVEQAQRKAYALVDKIKWEDGFVRRDIGHRAIAREQFDFFFED